MHQLEFQMMYLPRFIYGRTVKSRVEKSEFPFSLFCTRDYKNCAYITPKPSNVNSEHGNDESITPDPTTILQAAKHGLALGRLRSNIVKASQGQTKVLAKLPKQTTLSPSQPTSEAMKPIATTKAPATPVAAAVKVASAATIYPSKQNQARN
jgi:hypothetical protein